MDYPPVTKQQEEDIKKLFHNHKERKIEVTKRKYGYGYLINIDSDLHFEDGLSILRNFTEIARILNCKDGEEIDREHYYGNCTICRTITECEHVTLHFW